MLNLFLQFLINGLLVGGVYALLALGVVFIYRATQVFNFAVGDMVLFGAFVCWSFLVWAQWPVWAALLLALLVSFGLGLLIERLLMRPMIGQPLLSMIMATLGLSLFLRGVMSFIWSTSTVSYPHKLLPGQTLKFGGLFVSDELLWAFGVAILVFVVLSLFFQRGRIGYGMRATAEDHQVAQATGINVKNIFALTWSIAGLVAAIGGVLLASRVGLSVVSTPLVALKIFPAVLFGGLESILGAIVGGLLVGVLENLAGGLIDPKIAEITPYLILLLVLLIRPEGAFGLKRIERI
ncbi:MAG: branched-chain amino acid ABC transporter permease [Proteobacteria bacterium]|nr:branched-chain amino acid ABC transporter permease [Pseudomonadota bacterium]